MIQRIQSFYLILAACAMALCFMFPVAKYKTPDKQVYAQYSLVKSQALDKTAEQSDDALVADDFELVGGNMSKLGYAKAPVWPLMALVVVVIAIAVVSIFLYSNRIRQVRVVAVGFLLNVIYIFLVFIWAADAFLKPIKQAFSNYEWTTTYSVATWAPVVSVILLFLAQNAIKRDEKKVREADRIR